MNRSRPSGSSGPSGQAATAAAPRRLALVASTAPGSGDLDRVLELARAAAESGVDASLFFMDRAVMGLPARRAAIDALAELGCDLVACASSAHKAGLTEADVGMILGSQDDHAAMVHRAQRVVAFT